MICRFILLITACSAFAPFGVLPPPKHTSLSASNSVSKGFATAALALTLLSPATQPAVADVDFGTNIVVAEKVTREGIYGTYDVELTQTYDNAESTFKSKVETKSKKGKYTALLGVLVMGSFIIPMAQYFWYVRDDDSSDNFFASKKSPPPPPPPKKSGFKNPFARD